MRKLRSEKFILAVTVILTAFLRLYGINWDSGFHLHPDERWVTMVAERLALPSSVSEFFSPQSPLNPKSFAYGSFPFYLLKIAGTFASTIHPCFATYSCLNLFGRFLSTCFDLGTLILIYLIGKKFLSIPLRSFGATRDTLLSHPSLQKNTKRFVRESKNFALLASFFYAIAVFPIQNSHFYTVDTQLTFWCTLTIWLLTKFCDEPGSELKNLVLVGITTGTALATKITGAFLFFPAGITLLLKRITNNESRITNPTTWLLVTRYSLLVIFIALLTFSILEPYALIDFPTFKQHIFEQSQMSRDAMTFPYTYQYIGTIPYIYQLKNLILWGLGVPLGVTAVLGAILLSIQAVHRLLFTAHRNKHSQFSPFGRLRVTPSEVEASILPARGGSAFGGNSQLILLSFILPYLLLTGSFAVKFMRYWLPLYPFFCLSAACFIFFLRSSWILSLHPSTSSGLRSRMTKSVGPCLLFIVVLLAMGLYSLSFMNIYTQPHTRVAASEWINQNIPTGSTLATEHWDDELPLWGGEKYKKLKLNLYEKDTKEKIEDLNNKITQADYIVIASNRLYASIPKLPHQYPVTIRYYQRLFDGTLGFKKIAEFTSYPTLFLPFTDYRLPITDDRADESLTVYDHPKVMIFKKSENFSKEKLKQLLPSH